MPIFSEDKLNFWSIRGLCACAKQWFYEINDVFFSFPSSSLIFYSILLNCVEHLDTLSPMVFGH